MGDSVEYNAITRAFREYTSKTQFCALGTVKTNIGHAATAAGVAGVLKVLLALRHRQIPPSLHFQTASPSIPWESGPFYVNTQLKDWAVPDEERRRAAISSFGFSGTNAHLVIEEAPAIERSSDRVTGLSDRALGSHLGTVAAAGAQPAHVPRARARPVHERLELQSVHRSHASRPSPVLYRAHAGRTDSAAQVVDRDRLGEPGSDVGDARGQQTGARVTEEVWQSLHPGMRGHHERGDVSGASGRDRRPVCAGLCAGLRGLVCSRVQATPAADVPLREGALLDRHCQRAAAGTQDSDSRRASPCRPHQTVTAGPADAWRHRQ